MRRSFSEEQMMTKILLKLSGESLKTDIRTLANYEELRHVESHPNLPGGWGLTDSKMLLKVALDVQRAREDGLLLAIVIGGGNVCRGSRDAATGSQRLVADKIGMLATVVNGLILQNALAAVSVPSVVLSARSMPAVCDLYTTSAAERAFAEGRVVVCVGGSGQPFFSTDTVAVIRACELGCDVLLKATKVAGLYDADPVTHPDARLIRSTTYDDVLQKGLAIMDASAVALAKSQALPIEIVSTFTDNILVKAMHGEAVKSRIAAEIQPESVSSKVGFHKFYPSCLG